MVFIQFLSYIFSKFICTDCVGVGVGVAFQAKGGGTCDLWVHWAKACRWGAHLTKKMDHSMFPETI